MGAVDGAGGRVRRRRAKLPRWLAAVFGFLAILGPGLISANAGNDAGGIITYASAGSQFGYQMLFLMVLITVALVVVQEMCARRSVLGDAANGPIFRAVATLCVTVVGLLSAVVLVQTVAGWL